MCKVKNVQASTVWRKLHGSCETIGVCLALERAVDTHRIETLVSREVEDANPAVIPLGEIKGSVVRPHRDAHENTVRVGIGRFEARRNLRHLGLGAVQLGDDGGGERMRSAVGGYQSFAVRTERQAVRVRRYLDVPAQRSDQPAVGKYCFPGNIDLDRPKTCGRAQFRHRIPGPLLSRNRGVMRDRQQAKETHQQHSPCPAAHR